MQVYELKCSVCGKQLNFRETRDKDGDLVIEVCPCSACCLDIQRTLNKLELVKKEPQDQGCHVGDRKPSLGLILTGGFCPRFYFISKGDPMVTQIGLVTQGDPLKTW